MNLRAGPVPGSYADFITRACAPLLAAAENPGLVTPAEAAQWWPVVLAHSCRLLRLTRPWALRRPFDPDFPDRGWGLERLNDLPLTRAPAPVPRTKPRSPDTLREVAVNLAHAADLIETALDKARPLPAHERLGLCRQAIGVLDAAAQVVARATVFDPTTADTTHAALRTAAVTTPMVSGPQVLLSRLDSMTTRARRGSATLGDDLPAAVEQWRRTAVVALREGASSRIVEAVGQTQTTLLGLAADLNEHTENPAPAREPIDQARLSWDTDWRGIGIAGGEPDDLPTAQHTVHRAAAALTPHRMTILDVSILCEQLLDANRSVAEAAHRAVYDGIRTGKLFGRYDLVDPSAVAYGADPGQWISIHTNHQLARRQRVQARQCLHAAHDAADRFMPEAPSATLSAAGQVAAVLQALDAARPGGPTPGGRIQVAVPVPAVRR